MDAADSPRLELRMVDARYGPFRALFGVSLSVEAGRTLALLGPNGAGKTTVARVASGLVRPTAGAVVLDGANLTGKRAQFFARRGIAHICEGRSVFATLSVEDNLKLSLRRRTSRQHLSDALERAFALFPWLGARRHQLAGTLSGGEQRMLSLVWALVQPPPVIICDELSFGLSPANTDRVYDALRDVRAAGSSMLVIEQHVPRALSLADQVAVLNKGEVAFCGAASEVDSAGLEELAISTHASSGGHAPASRNSSIGAPP